MLSYTVQLHLSELVERERIIYTIGVACTNNINIIIQAIIFRFEDRTIDFFRVMVLRHVLDSEIQQDSFNVVYKKYSRSRYGRISKPFLQQVTRIPAAETIFDP